MVGKYGVLGSAGLIGTGVVGGGLVWGREIFSSKQKPKQVISEALKTSLMSFEDSSLSSKWGDRKTKLEKATDSSLIPSLKKIKDKSDRTGGDIKNGCKENAGGFVEDDGGKKFENVSDYCTFNIKDKITGTLVSDLWTTANGKLKGISSGLSSAMEKVKSDLSKSSEADVNALKNWCETAYEGIFLGNDDQSFIDASTYCVTP